MDTQQRKAMFARYKNPRGLYYKGVIPDTGLATGLRHPIKIKVGEGTHTAPYPLSNIMMKKSHRSNSLTRDQELPSQMHRLIFDNDWWLKSYMTEEFRSRDGKHIVHPSYKKYKFIPVEYENVESVPNYVNQRDIPESDFDRYGLDPKDFTREKVLKRQHYIENG